MRRLRKRLELWAGPRWPRPVRLLIALGLATLGFVCYSFHLTSAKQFALIGIFIAFVILLIRRALWKRSLAQKITG
jgi:hypothetical protein